MRKSLILLIVALAQPLLAAMTFTWESSERATTPEKNFALAVGPFQFVAARMTISDIIHVTQIGATMFSADDEGTFFAAILSLHDVTSLPGGNPLDGSEMGTTMFTAGSAVDDYFGITDIVLHPGHYAILIGSGEFGTSGLGGLSPNNIDHPWASYLRWTEEINPIIPFGGPIAYNSGAWADVGSGGYRMFLEGTVIPEPSTGILMLFGFIAVWINRRIAQQ